MNLLEKIAKLITVGISFSFWFKSKLTKEHPSESKAILYIISDSGVGDAMVLAPAITHLAAIYPNSAGYEFYVGADKEMLNLLRSLSLAVSYKEMELDLKGTEPDVIRTYMSNRNRLMKINWAIIICSRELNGYTKRLLMSVKHQCVIETVRQGWKEKFWKQFLFDRYLNNLHSITVPRESMIYELHKAVFTEGIKDKTFLQKPLRLPRLADFRAEGNGKYCVFCCGIGGGGTPISIGNGRWSDFHRLLISLPLNIS